MPKTILERFSEKWILHPYTGCWIWTGCSSRSYGQISHQGRLKKAHRVSYELYVGPVPEGEGYHGTCVCHVCDNTLCVNPAHLFLGTHSDNVRDMVEKDRQAKGEKLGMSKLTESDVIAIRADSRAERVIAADYPINRSTVGAVRRREIWRHLA